MKDASAFYPFAQYPLHMLTIYKISLRTPRMRTYHSSPRSFPELVAAPSAGKLFGSKEKPDADDALGTAQTNAITSVQKKLVRSA